MSGCRRKRITGALVIVAGLVVIGGEAITTIGVHGVAGDLLFVLAGTFFATFGMFLRKWRVVPTRAMVVTSVVSLAILPVYGLLIGFGRMIALGLWENLLQAVAAGPAGRTRRDLPVHALRRAARRRAGGGVSDPGAALRAADRLARAGQSAERAAIGRPRDRADRIPADPARLSRNGDVTWRSPNRVLPCHSFAQHLVAEGAWKQTDLQDTLDALVTTLRVTLRTELSSIWLPIQFGAIALAALAAWGCAAAIRRGSIWCRRRWAGRPICASVVRALVDNFGVLAFMVIIGVIRTAIRTWATHPRTYILGIAGDLATAWVVIALVASLIRNPFINRARLGDGLDHRGAEHPRPARRHRGRARRARHRDRRPARHAAAGAQDRGAAGGGAVGGDRDEQFPRPPRAARRGADAVDPGAARQAHPHRRDDRRHRHRAERGRHRPVGAGGVHRRDRRRRRPRHAEDRRRTSSAASSCWPTSRSSRATSSPSATISAGSPTWARATPRST